MYALVRSFSSLPAQRPKLRNRNQCASLVAGSHQPMLVVEESDSPMDLSRKIWSYWLANEDSGLCHVERTALAMAGIRAADKVTACPLIVDPLGEFMSGINKMNLPAMANEYGHVHGAARTFVIDCAVTKAIDEFRAQESPHIQVVNLGAGLDTRPWRLSSLGCGISWWELDMPDMISFKKKLLRQAAAEPLSDDQQPAFPLKCSKLTLAPCLLAATDAGSGLKQALLSAGYDPSLPTVWVAEGLLYYLDMDTVTQLFKDMSQLSILGSVAIMSAISKDNLESSRTQTQITLHNSSEDFATGGGSPGSPSLLVESGWHVQQLCMDVKDMLGELVQGETMFPLSVGTEGVIVAKRR